MGGSQADNGKLDHELPAGCVAAVVSLADETAEDASDDRGDEAVASLVFGEDGDRLGIAELAASRREPLIDDGDFDRPVGLEVLIPVRGAAEPGDHDDLAVVWLSPITTSIVWYGCPDRRPMWVSLRNRRPRIHPACQS